MDKTAFGDLVTDIKTSGQEFPIILYEGKVLDGVHRQDACLKADIEPQYVEFDGDDPLAYVVSANLKRRHLTESQRAMIAKKLVKLSKKVETKKSGSVPKGTLKQQSHQGLSDKAAARLMKVSRHSVARAGAVMDKGTEALQAAVDADEIPITPAAEIAKLPKEEQPKAIKSHIQRRHMRVLRSKPRTGFILELNSAWERADAMHRTRFLDSVGVEAIWNAMPDHQKEKLRHTISCMAIGSTPLPFEEKYKLMREDAGDFSTPEDLSIPDFLKR